MTLRISTIGFVFLLGLGAVGWAGYQAHAIGQGNPPQVEGATAANNVIEVSNEDQAIARSVEAARATLPKFLTVALTPPETWQMNNIKVALQGDNVIENIWVTDYSRTSGDNYQGHLANDPVNLSGMAAGDRVEFTHEQIVDWAFVEGDRGFGFYSARALLPMMDPDQAQGMQSFLSDNPVPDGW